MAAIAYVKLGWPLGRRLRWPPSSWARPGRFVQGTWSRCLGIPPFIVTLGGMLLFQGALLGVTGGVAVSPRGPFLFVGQTYVPPWLGLAGWPASLARRVPGERRSRATGAARWRCVGLAALALAFTAVMNAYEGIPVPVLLVLALAAVFSGVAQPHAASAATSTRSAATARRPSTPASTSSATSSACSP